MNDSSAEVTSFYCLVQKLDVSFVNKCSSLIKTSTDSADSMAIADRGSLFLITEGKRLNAKATEGSAWVGEGRVRQLDVGRKTFWCVMNHSGLCLSQTWISFLLLVFSVPLCPTAGPWSQRNEVVVICIDTAVKSAWCYNKIIHTGAHANKTW